MSKKWVHAVFPANLEKRARVLAAEQGISRSEFIRQATAEHVAKVEKEIGKLDNIRAAKEGAHENH